jgi:ubiquinone/menaquinone biosynthesis C-methylase UbiE/uncharacterized protein YbaR (Trm112 family)
MNEKLVNLITCCRCTRNQFHVKSFQLNKHEIVTGIIVCNDCSTWYPIVEGIPIVSINHVLIREAKEQLQREFSSKYDFSRLRSAEGTRVPEREQKQQLQISHFTHEAEHYDREVADTVFWQSVVANTVAFWATSTKKRFNTILEIGCGTGLTTIPLLKAGNRVIALDICFSALKKARENIEALNLSSSVDFIASEAEHLPFPSSSFQAAVFTGVLHHVAEPGQVVKEIGRVLDEGGSLFGFENNDSIFRSLFDILMKWFPLWHEEAGTEPLIHPSEAKRWGTAGELKIKTKSSVFLPPHFFNLFPREFARKLLFFSDYLFCNIPVIRNHGGLLILSGEKTIKANS